MTTLLEALQETVDDAWILEQADEILDIVQLLNEGEHEQLHDTDDNPVVRVYRHADGFNLHSTAFDIQGNDIQSYFRFSDYESGFDAVDGYDHKAASERREEIRTERLARQQAKQEVALERFLRIENAYIEGEKKPHPYLLAKGLNPEDVCIEYRVVTTDLFIRNQPMELLIYRLSENAYQVITPFKIELNGKPQDKFNIIREEGALKGAFSIVGDGEPEFIVEGLADAISANIALDRPIAIGLNAGNIKHIAETNPELILIGDNDDAGKLSAKQSGLDALFCPTHKDIDDMRQDAGLEATRRFLEQEVARIEQDREPLLGNGQRHMTLVSAPPGTGKSYHECRRIIIGHGLTIYAVHNKQAMGQRDSRVTMIREICESDSLTLPTIRRVNDSESEDGIGVQFNRTIEEYRTDETEDKNWVVFITHKGLSMLQFDLEGLGATLVIDEVPDAYHIHHQKMTIDNLSTYLSYFHVDVRTYSTHYIVKLRELSQEGLRFRRNPTHKHNMETKLYWTLIDQVLQNENHTKFLYVERGQGQQVWVYDGNDVQGGLSLSDESKLYKCEVFDVSKLDTFDSIRLLSDDCEHSTLALLLERTQGVQMEIERLPSRHLGGIAHRIDRIIGITEQRFSKHKMDSRPDLSNHIARAISDECDLTNSLWLLNNSSRESGDAVEYLRDAGYMIDDCNPMTHGRNDLTRFNTVIMLYSLKPSPIEAALMECLGISAAEMTRWREHNVHMQNAFRCFLRNPEGERAGTLIFPDKASIDYFLERVDAEWNEREALEEKVSYLTDGQVVAEFANRPAGRRQSGDEPLTGGERTKLAKWRRSMERLNDFAETVENGLKELASMTKGAVTPLYESWLAEQTVSPQYRPWLPEQSENSSIALTGYSV